MKPRKLQIAAAIVFGLLIAGSPSRGQESGANIDSISSHHVAIINPYTRPINMWIGGVKLTTDPADGMMEYECDDPCYISFDPKLGSYKVDLGVGYEIAWDSKGKRLYPQKRR